MDAFTRLRQFARPRDGVVTMAQALACGVARHEVDGLCRTGRFLPLARGAYLVDADLRAEVPRRALIRATVASFGPGAMAVLETAAELHGIAGLRRSDTVHVSVPVDAPVRQRVGDAVTVHQLTIPATAQSSVAGIPVTTPCWTVADVILRTDRLRAVSALDSALNQKLVTPDDLAAIPQMIRGRRGAVAARRYLGEVDGRAQSPLETRVRLRCVDGKVAPDSLQHEVRDEDGYVLAVGDLAWLRPRIIGEADGAGPHGTPRAVFEDRQRQNRIVNAGWVIVRFTWQDTLRPDYIPYVVRTALTTRLPG